MQSTTSSSPAGTERRPRPRISDRVRARVCAGSLDRELAGGVPRDASPALRLRAQALARPSVARELGDRLRWLVGEAHEPSVPGARLRGRRGPVLAAEYDLRLLASRLQSARAPTVLAIAKVRVLLTDGTGPLYYRGSDDNLGAAVRDAISALS